MRAGYVVLARALFRSASGFAGTRWARRSSFVHGPGAALRFARTLAVSPSEASAGHDPIGGCTVVALVTLLALQAARGFSRTGTLGPRVRSPDS